MTLDHVSFSVHPSKYAEVVDWYLAALAPLGYTKQIDIPDIACGLGDSPHNAKFWIGKSENASGSGMHIAFKANDHVAVHKFHEAAIKAGGKDNGGPGIREMYHPNYYAAFVFDPIGNNIEVVDHAAH